MISELLRESKNTGLIYDLDSPDHTIGSYDS